MKSLKGKRLLILGGSMWKDAIRKYANEQGIILVATGNNMNAGIFEIADEKYNINSIDADAMKQFIIDKKIDGVYLGGSEVVISNACVYLEELGLPCYTTKKQWEFLANKANLKDLYIRFGIPVAQRYIVDEDTIDSADIDFPVITKPVDGSGSNGFSVCHNKEELKYGYIRAKEASFDGDVLVERFVRNDSIVVVGRIKNGEFRICTIEDKYPVKYEKQGTYVAGMHLFESARKQEFIDLYERKLDEMLKSIGVKEGPIWFEVFLDGDGFCFNEVGFRYSGSITIWPVQYYAGINEVAEDINYALTGDSHFVNYEGIIPKEKIGEDHYCIYSLHLKPGKICRITGLDSIAEKSNVIAIPVAKNIGDVIEDTGSIGQVYGFVHFTYKSNEDLVDMIEEIHSVVSFEDEYGNNLLNRKIDICNLNIR